MVRNRTAYPDRARDLNARLISFNRTRQTFKSGKNDTWRQLIRAWSLSAHIVGPRSMIVTTFAPYAVRIKLLICERMIRRLSTPFDTRCRRQEPAFVGSLVKTGFKRRFRG